MLLFCFCHYIYSFFAGDFPAKKYSLSKFIRGRVFFLLHEYVQIFC